MRNRGIEIFLLPQGEEEAAVAAVGAPWHGGQGQQQGEQHAELVQVLALAGMPGTAVPRAMAAAHAAVAAHAAQRHRRPPGLRELRRWAALTAALAARGWRFGAALAAAWRQLYVRLEAASSAGAEEAASVAEAAFEAYLQPMLEAQRQGSSSGGDLLLYRPAAWPLPLGVAAFAADSASACASRDAAVLLLQLAVVAAAELQQRGHGSAAAAQLGSRTAWVHELGLGAAAAMPAAGLLRLLQGGIDGSTDSVTESSDSSEAALLCVPAAARVFAERCGPGQHKQRAALIDALSRQLVQLLSAAGAAGGPAELAAQQASQLVSGVLAHPLCAAASSLQQQLAAAIQLPAAARTFLPLDTLASQQLRPFLLAAGMPAGGRGDTMTSGSMQQLWQQVHEVGSKVAALWPAVQAAVVLQSAAATADASVAAGSATLLQLSCWRHQRPKVRCGGPAPAGLPGLPGPLEPLALQLCAEPTRPCSTVPLGPPVLQERARRAAPHPTLDWLYAALAGVQGLEEALLAPPAAGQGAPPAWDAAAESKASHACAPRAARALAVGCACVCPWLGIRRPVAPRCSVPPRSFPLIDPATLPACLQLRHMQQWRWALLRSLHQDPATSQPAALAVHYEGLLFLWMRLRKATAALLAGTGGCCVGWGWGGAAAPVVSRGNCVIRPRPWSIVLPPAPSCPRRLAFAGLGRGCAALGRCVGAAGHSGRHRRRRSTAQAAAVEAGRPPAAASHPAPQRGVQCAAGALRCCEVRATLAGVVCARCRP